MRRVRGGLLRRAPLKSRARAGAAGRCRRARRAGASPGLPRLPGRAGEPARERDPADDHHRGGGGRHAGQRLRLPAAAARRAAVRMPRPGRRRRRPPQAARAGSGCARRWPGPAEPAGPPTPAGLPEPAGLAEPACAGGATGPPWLASTARRNSALAAASADSSDRWGRRAARPGRLDRPHPVGVLRAVTGQQALEIPFVVGGTPERRLRLSGMSSSGTPFPVKVLHPPAT